MFYKHHSNKNFNKKFTLKLDNQTKERKLIQNEKNLSNLRPSVLQRVFGSALLGRSSSFDQVGENWPSSALADRWKL